MHGSPMMCWHAHAWGRVPGGAPCFAAFQYRGCKTHPAGLLSAASGVFRSVVLMLLCTGTMRADPILLQVQEAGVTLVTGLTELSFIHCCCLKYELVHVLMPFRTRCQEADPISSQAVFSGHPHFVISASHSPSRSSAAAASEPPELPASAAPAAVVPSGKLHAEMY